MKSETIHKRQIIDFLSEWAENKGEWASLLLDMVISKEDDITDDDRNKIYSYLEKSLGLNNNLPKLETKKYNFNANEINSVTIKSLSNVKGVNKLSPDQTINFSDKLTVVYGQNGTGKSGYSRIFKSLGYCYDKSKDLKIYPNIFSNDNPQLHATINCTINGEEKSFEWIGNTIEDLNSISIYDSKSVGISTSTKREIMITPAGFHLFSILSSELGKIEKLIDNKIISLSTKPEISDPLHSGTKQHEYYFTYPHNLTIDILNELSNFDEEADSQKLKSLIQQKGGLNLSALNERLRNLRIGQSEIEKLISNKQAIKDFVTIGNIEKFDELNDKLLSLKDSESSISIIAEEKGVELYNSKEFLSFIESAEKYIKQFDKNDLYPRDKDEELCIFCRQPLRDSSARKLIQDYRKVLNSTRNKEISTIQGKILEIKRNFSQLSCDFSFKYPIFEEKEMAENKGDNIVPFELTELINFSKNIKSVVIDNKEIQIQKFDFSNIDKLLEEKKENLSEQINALNDLSKNISTKVASIEKEINELEDKLVYKKNKNVLTNFINNLRYAASLRKAKTALSTKSLSTKLNEANSELVIKKFESKLMEELKFLRKDSIPITINFSATKGTTKVEQTLEKSYPISDILSEGETKAISLAEFLAEVELNATNAPVIFDDPVNSLDHRIIELVADRLIKLSYERQVILFTHNILLFNCIYTKSKESSFIETQNNSMYSGVIKENSNLKNNVKRRVSEINSKLNVLTSIITVEYLRYLYSCLRSTIELLVEQKIFQDVVKRYQSNVSMTNFQKVKGHLIDKRKDELNQIFERCCRFTEAHSSPEMVDTDPDINDFKSDLPCLKQFMMNSMSQFNHKEIKLEEAIEAFLCSSEGGYSKGNDKSFNAVSALDESALLGFIKQSQPKAWERYQVLYGTDSERKFIKRFCEEVESDGLIKVLRHGIKDRGVNFKVAYFAPETSINPELTERYNHNILHCVRQFHYSPSETQNTIDIVLLLNGIPVVALELKDEFSGQTVDDAIRQYKLDRNHKDPIFAFNRRLLVCFAVDLANVFMTTKVAGTSTYFLPFNQGSNGAGNVGGKGNPPNLENFMTSYLWEKVLRKDRLMEILQKYIHLDTKKDGKQNIIFPRYHQLDVVTKLLADVKQNGSGKNYLIQHSAGSGKSNSIAWLAHRLSGLHNNNDEKIFNSVIIVTDRKVLDAQLQDTVYQFDHTRGVVQKIYKNAKQLLEAINNRVPIIITTLQKFPVIFEQVKAGDRNFAVICDEAHSSQTGLAAKKLKFALANMGKELEEAAKIDSESGDEKCEYDNKILEELASHGNHKNLSFFAFTATPKGKTLQMFGTQMQDGSFRAYHIYYKNEKKYDGSIALDKTDGNVMPMTGTGKKSEPKKDKLSLIVDDINKQFGTHFTEMDKVLKQIENDLVNDPELQKFAKSDRETIRIVYDRLFPNRLLARHENNEEFFQKMCSDKKFMEDIMARLFPIVLQRLTK